MSDRVLGAIGASVTVSLAWGIGALLGPLVGFSRLVGAIVWVSAVLWCVLFDREKRAFT